MASVTQNFFRLFRGETGRDGELVNGAVTEARGNRRSSGLAEFTKLIAGQEGLCILDLGPTSPQNIAHLTGLGHRVYNEDVLLASMDPSFVAKNEDGTSSVNLESFLADNLKYNGQQFDAVIAWDIPDYLHESLVKAMVERLSSLIKPGGVLLAF